MEPLATIQALISQHAGPVGMPSPLKSVRLIAQSTPTAATSGIHEAAFALVVQGVKRTVIGNKVLEYGAGDYLVVPVELPVVGQVVEASIETPYLAFVWALDPASIAALMLDIDGASSGMGHQAGPAISPAPYELLDPIARLLRLLDRPEDAKFLRPMLEREILWRLLAGAQGDIVRQIGTADSRVSQISRAIREIRTHYADPLRVEDLATVAMMSIATFHRHFRAMTSMSPLQFQKQVRLHEARTRIIASTKDVAAVGFEVGYDSPSQFSREYNRFFGISPSKDTRQLRGTSRGK
jgi:AraC-like DNA-binding protein